MARAFDSHIFSYQANIHSEHIFVFPYQDCRMHSVPETAKQGKLSLTSCLATITCIRMALIDLLQRKHYSEISMTDIIKKSGISRSGVYKNYKNKAEIIFDIYQEPIDEVIRALGTSIFENMEMIFRTGKNMKRRSEPFWMQDLNIIF